MGLSRTVSEIDFSRKLQKNSHLRVLCAPAEGVSLQLGIGAGSAKNGMMGLPDGPKSFKIALAV